MTAITITSITVAFMIIMVEDSYYGSKLPKIPKFQHYVEVIDKF